MEIKIELFWKKKGNILKKKKMILLQRQFSKAFAIRFIGNEKKKKKQTFLHLINTLDKIQNTNNTMFNFTVGKQKKGKSSPARRTNCIDDRFSFK